jgi:hypothetical protein
MDRRPDPSDVPEEVVAHIMKSMKTLREEWDRKHPQNPVESGDDR